MIWVVGDDPGQSQKWTAALRTAFTHGSVVPRVLPPIELQRTDPARGAPPVKSAEGQNVRLWHLADIRSHASMSAFGGKADIASAAHHVCKLDHQKLRTRKRY